LSYHQKVLSGLRNVFEGKEITFLCQLIHVLKDRLDAVLALNIHSPHLLSIAQQFLERVDVCFTEEGRDVEFECRVVTAISTVDFEDIDRTARSVLKVLSAHGGTVVGGAAVAVRPTDHPVLLLRAVRLMHDCLPFRSVTTRRLPVSA
jgi:hypothetical protein